MKTRLARQALGAVAAAGIALGAFGASSAQAQTLDVVNVAVGPGSLTFTPIYLADRLGYFKAEGLDIHFVTINSAALEVAPLSVGQIDVGGGAVSAGLYNAVARGLDVKIVADLGSDPKGYGFDQLVVRKALVTSGAYKSVKDLKGKTFGITGKGISTTATVNALLQTGGLSIDDVKIQVLPVSDQLTALGTGGIDASVMPEPGPTQAEHEGVAVRMLSNDAYYPDQALVAMFFGMNFTKTKHAVGVRFMRAYLKGVRLYNNNLRGGHIAGPQADTIMSIFAEMTKQDRALLSKVTPPGNNPNGQLNLASLQRDYDFFKSQGLIEKEIPAKDAVDGSFVAEALKTMGPYKK